MDQQDTQHTVAQKGSLFERMKACERVLFVHTPQSGLQAMAVIHQTRGTFSLGGCRMWSYPTWEVALDDLLVRAETATLQAAIHHLPVGGAAFIILGDPTQDKTPERLMAFSREISSSAGACMMMEDMGINVEDLAQMREASPRYPLSEGGGNRGLSLIHI